MSKFIELTGDTGDKAYVNMDHVFSVIDNPHGNTILTQVGGRRNEVQESYAEIMEKIKETEK